MEGEDRKDLWRELVTVCGGSKDSVCKFRFSIMIMIMIMTIMLINIRGGSKDTVCKFRFSNMLPSVSDRDHDDLIVSMCGGSKGPFRFCNMILCMVIMVMMIWRVGICWGSKELVCKFRFCHVW